MEWEEASHRIELLDKETEILKRTQAQMMSLNCSAREISKISKRPYRYEKLVGQSNGAGEGSWPPSLSPEWPNNVSLIPGTCVVEGEN